MIYAFEILKKWEAAEYGRDLGSIANMNQPRLQRELAAEIALRRWIRCRGGAEVGVYEAFREAYAKEAG